MKDAMKVPNRPLYSSKETSSCNLTCITNLAWCLQNQRHSILPFLFPSPLSPPLPLASYFYYLLKLNSYIFLMNSIVEKYSFPIIASYILSFHLTVSNLTGSSYSKTRFHGIHITRVKKNIYQLSFVFACVYHILIQRI